MSAPVRSPRAPWNSRDIMLDVSCAALLREPLASYSGEPPHVAALTEQWVLHEPAGEQWQVAVVGAANATGWPTAPLVAALRRRCPAGMIVVASSDAVVQSTVADFARAGADRVVTITTDAHVQRVLELARRRVLAPAPAATLLRLQSLVAPWGVLALATHCVRNSSFHWGIQRLAEFFGRTPQALNAELRRHDLPSIGLLQRYGLALHAQELEERGISGRSEIAFRLGLPDSKSLQARRRRIEQSQLHTVLAERGRQTDRQTGRERERDRRLAAR